MKYKKTPDNSTNKAFGAAVVSPATLNKIKEAREARDLLAAALTRAGIQLPAMDIREPAVWQDEPRYALVHLGECSAPVARALAQALTCKTAL